MNKKEFLEELSEHLIGISKEDREEILQDYKEHFKIGKKKKRSEKEIIRSLGVPKEIAREIRRELSSSEKAELKSEAIETWVATKRLSRHLFNEARNGIDKVLGNKIDNGKENRASTWILIALILIFIALVFKIQFFIIVALIFAGYFLYKYLREKRPWRRGKKIKDANKKGNKNIALVVISIIFNLCFFIWLWISLFLTIIALFISSLAILIGGVIVVIFAIYSLISHGSEIINDILLAGLFSGIGIAIFGGLLFWFSRGATKIFFLLTKKYIALNMRFVRK